MPFIVLFNTFDWDSNIITYSYFDSATIYVEWNAQILSVDVIYYLFIIII